jgi:hypothetical protein
MDFVAVMDQVIALLRQRGRLTYRTLQRQFHLDDAALEDLKLELIEGQCLASDERGTVLVWTGGVAAFPTPAPGPPSRRHPASTPRRIWRRKSSPPAARSKANGSRSRCCLPTSKAPRN